MEEFYKLVRQMRAKLPAGRVRADLDYDPRRCYYVLGLAVPDRFGQSLMIQQAISEELFDMWAINDLRHTRRELQYYLDRNNLQVLEPTVDLSMIFINSFEF